MRCMKFLGIWPFHGKHSFLRKTVHFEPSRQVLRKVATSSNDVTRHGHQLERVPFDVPNFGQICTFHQRINDNWSFNVSSEMIPENYQVSRWREGPFVWCNRPYWIFELKLTSVARWLIVYQQWIISPQLPHIYTSRKDPEPLILRQVNLLD